MFPIIHWITDHYLIAVIYFSLATDDQKFKDSGIYYQFLADATSDQPLQQTDFAPIATFTCQTIMVSLIVVTCVCAYVCACVCGEGIHVFMLFE